MVNPVSRCITITTVIDGVDGYSTAIVRMYRRSDTPLTASDLPLGTLTYDFASGELSGTLSGFNGWTQAMPAEDADTVLYVTMATAMSREATDGIAPNEWSVPVEFSEGLHTATVILYKRSATALSAHGINVAVYYRFSDGRVFTTKAAETETAIEGAKLNGWTRTPPATDGNPCYVVQATAVGTDDVDRIATSEWSTPAKYVEDGEDSYHVEIWGADKILNGQGSITLTAHAFKGDDDVTETLSPLAFSWEKSSSDAHADANWNALHRAYGNSVTIGNAEVLRKATFACVVNYDNTL